MKIINFLCSILLMILCACNPTEKSQNDIKSTYKAINLSDTATLHIILKEKEFYGQLEISYRGAFKDSGDVTGIVKSDTLKGTYRFQHYGMQKWHSKPIALLIKNDKLIMGEGMIEIYMNMQYFKKNKPINYQNPKFVFEKNMRLTPH